MPSLYFEPLSLAVVGLGGIVQGLAESLFRKRGEASWRFPLLLAGVFVLLGGLGLAFDQPQFLWQGALLLSGVEVVLALLRSPLLPRLATLCWGSLRLGFLKQSLVQGLILLLLGGGLLAAQVYHIDRSLEQDLNRNEFEMAQMTEPSDLSPEPVATARTDTDRSVPLFNTLSGTVRASEQKENNYLDNARMQRKLIQTSTADATYNCHGWVFTGGRFWLRSGQIDGILKDNGYQQTKQPRPGDVAVFRNPVGEVTHSGLVRGDTDNGPLIESKWGKLGRYVHTADEHCYQGNSVTYYRSARGSHLLNGLESPRTGEPVVHRPSLP
jgi:hypothetical protein